MQVDDLYMGALYLAEYGMVFNSSVAYGMAIRQATRTE